MIRRILPAVGLFFLAPLVAEWLLGNMPVTALFLVPPFALMYGGGALLVREVTRRTGRGWPTILLLGVAYGLLEEGVGTQSLFNPHYVGLSLLSEGYVPVLGIGLAWTFTVLTLHAAWSVCTPIVMAEGLSRRRTEPWLGRVGLAVTAVLFVLGLAFTFAISVASDRTHFMATPGRLAGVVALAAVLVVIGLRLPRRTAAPERPRTGRAPHPALVLAVTLVLGVLYELPDTLELHGLPVAVDVAHVLVVDAVAIAGIALASRRAGWGDLHRLALGAGALLTYAWHAFPETPVFPAPPAVDLAGNALFAAGALVLIVVSYLRIRRPESLVVGRSPARASAPA